MQNKGESDHFLGFLENLEIVRDSRDSSGEKTPFAMTTFFRSRKMIFLSAQCKRNCQGQISAQGILHLGNPNLVPNSGKSILDARISDPDSWVEFFEPVFFQQKRPPEKFTLEKFTSRNSPYKIQPRNPFG